MAARRQFTETILERQYLVVALKQFLMEQEEAAVKSCPVARLLSVEA
jgi:hypothetical protein